MAEFTLVSFNTHYGLLPLRENCGPYDVMRALVALGDPDILVVQEVWRRDGERAVVDDFAVEHGYKQHDLTLSRATIETRWPQPSTDGQGTIGLAVLSRLPASVVGAPLVGPTWADQVTQRRVLQLVVELDDTPFDLTAVHLTSRLPHGPPIQLRRLARLLPPTGRPGIVAGDCNFWGPPTSMMLPGWQRAVRGRTWPAARPHSQIDHVFTRGNITVIDAQVYPDLGSDHRPIGVRLRLGS
jgi:endonuclease/exonuclease/phosphatase family metal-dependent hydrolase